MGGRGEGLALALLRVALGLLWLQDLVLPRPASQSWLVGALGLPGTSGWVVPALELALVVTLLTGFLVRPAAAVGAALGVAGVAHLAVPSGGVGSADATGAWAVVLLALVHLVLLVGGGGSWAALDAVRRSGDPARAVRLGRGWGLLALAAGTAGVVVASGGQPRWTAEHTLVLRDGLVSVGTWDLPGALAVGVAGLVLLLGTLPRMSPMALVALLVAGAAAVMVALGVLAGGTSTASLLAAVAVVAAVVAPHLRGDDGGGGPEPEEA
jgi:hypothetical protein